MSIFKIAIPKCLWALVHCLSYAVPIFPAELFLQQFILPLFFSTYAFTIGNSNNPFFLLVLHNLLASYISDVVH